MNPTPLRTLDERRAAAALALLWGYPGPIAWYHIVHARWFRTELGIAWLIEGIAAGTVCMHGIRHPDVRGVISPELTAAALQAARDMGATRVYQGLPSLELIDQLREQARKHAGMRRLWQRAGWELDEFGAYLDLDSPLCAAGARWERGEMVGILVEEMSDGR